MIKKFIPFNESIRDMMTPKSDEEIELAKLKRYGVNSKEELEKAIKGDGISKVYKVYSGVDAFDFKTEKGNHVYLPYVAIIATSELDARIKTAELLGQELFDQDINNHYDNYVSSHVVFEYNF